MEMTPEKEAELFGEIVDMIQQNFDHAQFADVEQELISAGHFGRVNYTYEEMWNILEACGLDMDAILDKLDDYGMGKRETVLCTLDIVVDGNVSAEDKEEESTVTPEPDEDTEDIGSAEDTDEENIPQEETSEEDSAENSVADGGADAEDDVEADSTADNTETVVDMTGTTEHEDDVQNGNPSQDTAEDSDFVVDSADDDVVDATVDTSVDGAESVESITGGEQVEVPTDNEEAPESYEPAIEEEDVPLNDIEKVVEEVLGETGLTEEVFTEIQEEEVPLVAAPSAEAGKGNGWMLPWFFLLLLILAILVGRAAYKKLESKAKEADE